MPATCQPIFHTVHSPTPESRVPIRGEFYDDVVRGQIPGLESTISGLRVWLTLAVGAIFLLLMANFQSLRIPLPILSMIRGIG
jgi:hypothetical protein